MPPDLRALKAAEVRGTAPGAGTLPGPLAARAGNRGDPHGEHGPGLVSRSRRAVVAAWPAVSLVGSYELLVWLIRTSGTPDYEPSAEHRCGNTACRAAERSVPAAIVDSEQHSRSDRDPSAQGSQPAGQPAGQPATSASAQHGGDAPKADADNFAAVAAYQLSAHAGNPLSERKLAQMFGRTSRRWARARIAEAQLSP